MKWLEYLVVAAIAALAVWLAYRGRRAGNNDCADCPLTDSCAKKNIKETKKSPKLLHKPK